MSYFKSNKVASTPSELFEKYSSLAMVQLLSTSVEERERGESNKRICKAINEEYPELNLSHSIFEFI